VNASNEGRPDGYYVEVTTAAGGTAIHPGGEWVHVTRRGTLQVRKGPFRRLARYPAGTWRGHMCHGAVFRYPS